MDLDRITIRHVLAALAYRTQKALRGADDQFAHFSAGSGTRTPVELVRHRTSVLGYVRTFFIGVSMTHAGQLAMLRRLAGSPLAPENLIFDEISADRVGPDQPMPAAPDSVWLGKLIQVGWRLTGLVKRNARKS